ncbi:hypothetical protein MTO96_041400 [Rhipicephalus appendiculatus]
MEVARCLPAAAVYQSSIYVVGGFNSSGPLRSAERYDVHTDMWVRIASMRDHRMGASAAAACGRIIVAGGASGEGTLNTIESYDPTTDTWTHVTHMSSARTGLRAVVHDEEVYLLGGHNGGLYLTSVEKLDVRERRLTLLPLHAASTSRRLRRGARGQPLRHGHLSR